MTESQPGYVIKMVAKPGNGDSLRKLVTDGMAQANTGGTWVHCLVEDEPETSWTFELFESAEAKTQYEEGSLADKPPDEIIDLLAGPPLRVPVTPFSASWLPLPS